MNQTIKTCSKCGAEIPPEAPHGLCPKCVMGSAIDPSAATQTTAAVPEPPPLDKVAAAFPQLEVVELIGAGGMGAVYKARQMRLERWVALKILPEKLASDPAFTERFTREARLLARLNHPNIVAVYDFGQSGGYSYLLMEYVDGINLRDAMAAGRFSPAQALAVVPRICEALQYAHDEGILHRDIKPANILLDAKGRVKIADFGIAKLLGATPDFALTASGAAVGTPHYMAPEQLEHPKEIDQRADIYSLGVVFYEMLTGELPIGRFAPPSEKSSVDPRVDPIVLRTLERDREKRFHSASEVKTSVENMGSSAPPIRPAAAPAASPPITPARPPKWSGKAVLAAVLGSLSVALGAGLVPLGMIILRMIAAHQGSIGSGELLILSAIALGIVGLGLAGFILGLVAKREIRDSQGALRGTGVALYAVCVVPILALGVLALIFVGFGFFSLGHFRTGAPTPPPGLVLNVTRERRDDDKLTEVGWHMSVAPARAVTFSINVLSNGIPVLIEPMTRSFTTPEFAPSTEGEFSVKLWPHSGDQQPPWRAELKADGVEPATLECSSTVPQDIEWRTLINPPRIVVDHGTASAVLVSGIQQVEAGAESRTASWEARLNIEVLRHSEPKMIHRLQAHPEAP